jgi:hypothetical protein
VVLAVWGNRRVVRWVIGAALAALLLFGPSADATVVRSDCAYGGCGVTVNGTTGFNRLETNSLVFENPSPGQVRVTENGSGTPISGEGQCTGGGTGPGAVVTCAGGPYTHNYMLLEGGNDRAQVVGNASIQEVSGGDGDDTLIGGNGPETLFGGYGADRMFGGGGNDFLRARVTDVGAGSADPDLEIDCGDGTDTANLSSGDPKPAASCETVTGKTFPDEEKGSGAAASGLSFSHSTFRAASSGPSAESTKKKRPVGTKVTYTLSEVATVKFTVKRRVKGRKVRRHGKKVCLKPTRKNRKKRKCKRYKKVRGSFTQDGKAGKNSFRFTGRLRGHKLKPGRYKLIATPSVNGQKGKATSRRFRIVR